MTPDVRSLVLVGWPLRTFLALGPAQPDRRSGSRRRIVVVSRVNVRLWFYHTKGILSISFLGTNQPLGGPSPQQWSGSCVEDKLESACLPARAIEPHRQTRDGRGSRSREHRTVAHARRITGSPIGEVHRQVPSTSPVARSGSARTRAQGGRLTVRNRRWIIPLAVDRSRRADAGPARTRRTGEVAWRSRVLDVALVDRLEPSPVQVSLETGAPL